MLHAVQAIAPGHTHPVLSARDQAVRQWAQGWVQLATGDGAGGRLLGPLPAQVIVRRRIVDRLDEPAPLLDDFDIGVPAQVYDQAG
ncbi:hypothetical protein GCM10009733_108930 [Nonomuraea maheshkhaliensis]|uniref:Uncharacterized protein n=1 Tax=Nonomuraea maheshkhaliensis TaxID=419590 RepID=A0ABP4U101_9ACTN